MSSQKNRLCVATCLAVAPFAVFAQPQYQFQNQNSEEPRTLQFSAGLGYQHDSNVFRLSDQSNAQALIGTPTRSDDITTATAGLQFNKAYGLQRFEARGSVENTSYSRFSNLDFTSVNYDAAWRWSLTPAFRGNLTTDRREYVDRTADVQNLGQINRRTTRTNRLDGEYDVDGVWRLLGGVTKTVNSNSQPATFEGEADTLAEEVGIRYALPFGTSVAYRFRNGQGKYSNQALGFVSSDFKDRQHELEGRWEGGRATLVGRISYLERNFDSISARDYSGVIGQVDATYALTGKTSLTGGVGRELGSYQTNNSSYYNGTRIFGGPTWRATDNITVRARVDYGVRNFKGALPGFAASNREDKITLATASVEWQPIRLLSLMLWAQRDQRKSNEFGADYKSNAVGVSAKATF
jgi:exopolysaccharide biosynthesis operon protein EpsL